MPRTDTQNLYTCTQPRAVVLAIVSVFLSHGSWIFLHMSCVIYNSICISITDSICRSITDTHSLYIHYLSCTEPGAAITCGGFCANVQKKKSTSGFLPTNKDTRRGLLCGSFVF